MLNHLRTVMNEDHCPVLRTSKFASVYCIGDPCEGNVYMVIWKRELLESVFRKFVVTLFKTQKLNSIIGMSAKY